MYEHRRNALQALVDSLGRGGIASIAQQIGKDPSYVSRMLYPAGKSGAKRIGEDTAHVLAKAFPAFFGVARESLPAVAASHSATAAQPPVGVPTFPRDDPPEGYVRLQHLSPQPSMGHGSAICEPIEVVRHLDVLENWVHQKVGSANYDRIKILTGCGQSMRPTIQDQDLVFVDISQRFIDIPGIYVIDVCGRFLLKRALILSDGTLVLKSDNTSEFPDEEKIDLRHAADSINVAGRVKAWWTLHQG